MSTGGLPVGQIVGKPVQGRRGFCGPLRPRQGYWWPARRRGHSNDTAELADHILLLEIVDDGRNDWMERCTAEGGRETVPNRENIQRSRLRYEARCKLLSDGPAKFCGDRTAPEAKDEVINPWEEILRLVDGKTRGLPSQHQPIDQREREEFERKFQKAAGPPSDRL